MLFATIANVDKFVTHEKVDGESNDPELHFKYQFS